MIGNDILDEIIPVPELEELKDTVVSDLKAEQFAITNFHSGGVFYTLLMIALRIKIELLNLSRSILNQLFISHASGFWLDLKAADYSKKRKAAQKTRGYVTITRTDSSGEAIQIAKGNIFKTAKDINGEELRFFSLEDTVLKKGSGSVDVLVEAEKVGTRYNVPKGQITRTLIYLGDVTISNGENWISREGSDTESDDSLRTRCLRSWAELASVPVHDTYVNTAEAVAGVLYATVNDQHPRGQGTIDVIVTSEAGAASETLLTDVKKACEAIKAPDDDILVKSAVTVTQDITLTVTIPSSMNSEGLSARVEAAMLDLLKIRKRQQLNELTRADIIYKVKSEIAAVRNVIVAVPATDVQLTTDKVILPGTITVTVQGV